MTILRTTFLSLMSGETYPLAQIHRPSVDAGEKECPDARDTAEEA
jgi:hypothetical protein